VATLRRVQILAFLSDEFLGTINRIVRRIPRLHGRPRTRTRRRFGGRERGAGSHELAGTWRRVDWNESAAEQIGDASNVLLVASSRTDAADRACVDLLTLADPAEESVLSVTLTQSPADRMAVWERWADSYPPKAAFLAVGSNGTGPHSPADRLRQRVPDSTALAVDEIDNPGDLMRLGVGISDRLAEFANADRQIVMCVHSLSTLFQYTEPERLFRFLHVLTSRVEQVGAVAHYHIEPEPHDEASIRLLESLFDVTLEIDNEGE
jgi:hypothetical protein